MDPNVLEIDGLTVSFFTDEGEAKAVNGVRFAVPRGKVLALVGESGCGKSVTSYSILRLIQKPGRITGGHIRYHGADGMELDLAAVSEKDPRLYEIRGNRIAMIFQEPMTAHRCIRSAASCRRCCSCIGRCRRRKRGNG